MEIVGVDLQLKNLNERTSVKYADYITLHHKRKNVNPK